MNHNINYYQGFTLLELTISFFLASILMALCMQQVFQFKRQSEYIHHQLNETMDIQWLIDFMRSRVYQAGFTPCRKLDDLIRTDTRDKPGSLSSIELNEKHDRVLFHHMGDEVLQMDSQLNTHAFGTELTKINIDHPVLISDCYHAEVHTVKQVIRQGQDIQIVLKEPLIYDYLTPVYLGEWVTEVFFLRNTQVSNALYYQYHRVDKLIPQVQSFNVTLGKAHRHALLHVTLILDTLRRVELDIRARNA